MVDRRRAGPSSPSPNLERFVERLDARAEANAERTEHLFDALNQRLDRIDKSVATVTVVDMPNVRAELSALRIEIGEVRDTTRVSLSSHGAEAVAAAASGASEGAAAGAAKGAAEGAAKGASEGAGQFRTVTLGGAILLAVVAASTLGQYIAMGMKLIVSMAKVSAGSDPN